MSRAAAEAYKAAHLASIVADMDAKREAARSQVIRPLAVGYPTHEQRPAGHRELLLGNAPDFVYDLVEVKTAAVSIPNAPGITVTIDPTDYTGGRDENGQRVEDGHGAVINITTAEGTLEVRHGYQRHGSADRWRVDA